jgi:hypothetical protein
MTREEFINTSANFCWNFCSHFLVHTDIGDFIWDDPDYNGDNTFTYVGQMSVKQFCKDEDILYVRDKGTHIIKKYCGPDIKIVGYKFEE